jgi:hypothetical protein
MRSMQQGIWFARLISSIHSTQRSSDWGAARCAIVANAPPRLDIDLQTTASHDRSELTQLSSHPGFS